MLNDQFGSWDHFLAAIEAQSEVRVLGVTDYCSIENYSMLKQHQETGRIPDIDLIVPNIEFRISPPNEQARAVNLHLLICPDDPNHETQIRNALGRLTCKYASAN